MSHAAIASRTLTDADFLRNLPFTVTTGLFMLTSRQSGRQYG
ncbi:hypothetical protein AAIG39_01975 [Phytobacter palmae]|uniref:Uncharacterized protein n=1 Tax=Phytobacter palmae TaxID=1855371 RepID=A0ABU9UZF6_9ENTR